MNSVLNKLTGFSQAVMDWFILSLSWFLGVALGLVVLGLAPSTVALIGATDERFVEENATSAWRLFWQLYRKWFNSSSRSLLPSIAVLGFLAGDYALMRRLFEGEVRVVFTVILGLLIVSVGLAMIYQLCSFVEGEMFSLLESLGVVLKKPLHNLAFITVTFAVLRLGNEIYGFVLLLAPGIWAWLIVILSKRIDRRSN